MKKIIAIMLTLVFVFAFTACLDLNKNETTSGEGESTSAQDETSTEDTTAAEPQTDENGSTVATTANENSTASGETTTKHEKTTVSAAQTGGSKAYAALASGNFYMACTVTADDGTKNSVVFASKGDDIRMNVNVQGSDIGIIIAGGKMIMLYDKSYAELDESTLSGFGVGSVDELVANLGVGSDFAADMFSGLTYSKSESGTYNGQSVTKFFYTKSGTDSEQTILYEADGGKLVCMENLDANGKVTQTMVFSDFKTEAPADSFSVDGYTQTDFFDLMMEMYKVINGASTTE